MSRPARDRTIGNDTSMDFSILLHLLEPSLRAVGELSEALVQREVQSEELGFRVGQRFEYGFIDLGFATGGHLFWLPAVQGHKAISDMVTAGRIEDGFLCLVRPLTLDVATGFVVRLRQEGRLDFPRGEGGLEAFTDFGLFSH